MWKIKVFFASTTQNICKYLAACFQEFRQKFNWPRIFIKWCHHWPIFIVYEQLSTQLVSSLKNKKERQEVCSPMWVSSPQRAISDANLPRVSFLVLSSMLYKWVRTPGSKGSALLCGFISPRAPLQYGVSLGSPPWYEHTWHGMWSGPEMTQLHCPHCHLSCKIHNLRKKCNHKIMYDLNMGGPVRFQKQHRHI